MMPQIFDKFFDFFVDTLILAFLPLVHLYHIAVADFTLNVAADDAVGLEKIGNELLIPYQFVFSGQRAFLDSQGNWHFEQRFASDEAFWIKMSASLTALPVSLVFGGTIKSLAFLSKDVRQKHQAMKDSFSTKFITSNIEMYQEAGLSLCPKEKMEVFQHQNYQRREKDKDHLKKEKIALKEIVKRLDQFNIVWWADCGTCIGAYRYGGIIPWDHDIDIALLLPDFENALKALSTLDPEKYIVQDWSSRDLPKTYLKVFLKESDTLIDLYFFDIDQENKTVQFILSLENNVFLPNWWRIREGRFKVPTPFDVVFPLKKGVFDGIEVYIPNNPEKYLQLRYGEVLTPAKVYDPTTDQYEKDLSHPYWQRAYVH